MKPLSHLRQDWTAVQAEETRLLRQLSLTEGMKQYLALQREFEPVLRETAALYAPQRAQALQQWQARLVKLNNLRGNRMDSLITSLIALQQRLERANLPCMAIGGLVVGIWGEPRLTRDVDVKVLAQREDRQQILDTLRDYSTLNADADEALRRNGVAFYQDQHGVRIDILLAETFFDETAVGRAKVIEVQPGQQIRVCTAEDLIIYKMLSLRPRDRADVEGIIRRQGDALDDQYVLQWLREFEQALDDSTLVTEYQRLRRETDR